MRREGGEEGKNRKGREGRGGGEGEGKGRKRSVVWVIVKKKKQLREIADREMKRSRKECKNEGKKKKREMFHD